MHLYPRSVSVAQLMGSYSEGNEWLDGVLVQQLRAALARRENTFVLLDAVADNCWLEPLSFCSDENCKLSLSNGEVLSLGEKVQLLVETPSIDKLGPSVVTQMGLLVFRADPKSRLEVLAQLLEEQPLPDDVAERLKDLAACVLLGLLDKVDGDELALGRLSHNQCLAHMFRLFYLMALEAGLDRADKRLSAEVNPKVDMIFAYASTLAVSPWVQEDRRPQFEQLVRRAMKSDCKCGDRAVKLTVNALPDSRCSLFEMELDLALFKWKNLRDQADNSMISTSGHTFIDTIEASALAYPMLRLARHDVPVLLLGPASAGRSIVSKGLLARLDRADFEVH